MRQSRRRPRNRRAQIAAVAAEAFSATGYHGVSMDEIAARLELSSTALYRHYPSKYALFRAEALRLGEVWAAAIRLPPMAANWPIEQRVEHLLEALIAASITNRRSAALLRWQGRYLKAEDRAAVATNLTAVAAMVRTLLGESRPELDASSKSVLGQTIQSIVSSIGDHHVAFPAKTLALRLREACLAVWHCELPPAESAAALHVGRAAVPPTFTHELVLKYAVILFHERGYPNVSVEDIAAAAGLPTTSAVYRFYHSKGDILAAAFRRAAEQVSAAIGPAIAAADSPAHALTALIDLFVAGSFAERELTFVYYAEISNVPLEQRTRLRTVQRLNVQEWAKLLSAARPELTAAESRLLVHTAQALVVDLGRRFGSDDPACSQQRVAHLMRTVLVLDR
ncbi:TetR family transcriptional regulator [Nocardia uniformis]|uniref:TetR family transcriptional regulator n=1 Tax=Nocardia uniformis TaxID=53432 RepID=A0A849CEP6_9NOCA|nr:TetR family transcriptional regulator [Nocardia uniformis]